MAKKVYSCIKKAIESGKLKEPFNTKDFKNICKENFAENTYLNFLNKHKVGNGKETELFIKNEDNKTYTLVKPCIVSKVVSNA